LGVSLALMHSVLSDVRARADGTNDVEQEGRSLIDASGSAIAGSVGVTWEPSPEALWLGASYHSRPNFAGGMKLEGTVDNLLGTQSEAPVEVTYDLPDIVRVGARYRPTPRYELRLFGDYTRWSAFESQCIANAGFDCTIAPDGSQPAGGGVLQNIRREWRDAVEVRAGFSAFVSDAVEFFSGLGVSSSAVPDATFEAGLPDFPGASFALGARLKLGESVGVAGSVTQLVFAPRNVSGSLHTDELPTRQPDASGTYKQLATVLNLNADFRL
jgi:long-chain fatty acid transport protein